MIEAKQFTRASVFNKIMNAGSGEKLCCPQPLPNISHRILTGSVGNPTALDFPFQANSLQEGILFPQAMMQHLRSTLSWKDSLSYPFLD